MNSPVRLFITDLDNTLYDWVTYFAQSFEAMTKALVPLLQVDEQTILDEFKVLHHHYGNSEQPFVVLELPSVRRRFGAPGVTQLMHDLNPALHAFNSTRKRVLRLYEGVESTLRDLRSRGVIVVGHTEAIAVNAYYRLKKLGIVEHFQRLYALEGHVIDHPDRERRSEFELPLELIKVLPKSERKPNPRLLIDVCEREGVSPKEAAYIGDSLTRDISMAKVAGVRAIWARYGTHYDGNLWKILVRVTHWSDEDVRREESLKRNFAGISPDHEVDSFDALLRIPEVRWGTG
jgi:phosphoglycolate phosphatase